MRLIQPVAILLVLLLGGCASAPPPAPPPFLLKLEPTPPAGYEPLVLVAPMRVDDVRDVPDPTRIGEVHAPGGAPLVGAGTREGAVAMAALQFVLLANPLPTGRYLVVADALAVAHAIERVLTYALQQSKRHAFASGALEATVRRLWIRPAWTTTCDVVIEVRLAGPGGRPLWERTLESHVDKFEGWFTAEAFERVARMALDQLVEQAAAAFGSSEFGAAIATAPSAETPP